MYKKIRWLSMAFLGLLLFSSCAMFAPNVSQGNNGDSSQSSSDERVEEGYSCTVSEGSSGVDFIIDFQGKKDITLLQITDTQLQDYYGARNSTRESQIRNAFFGGGLSKSHQIRAWRYVDEAVKKAQPDLIIATGDNIYGELDDDGGMWQEFCSVMDSYQIPWMVVFGNHDNESAKGVTWQVNQLYASEYCVFKQGEVTGNCNYNVLIRASGEPKYLFYMFDTNGCCERPNNYGEGLMPDNVDIAKIRQRAGVGSDQLNWFTSTAETAFDTYGEVPILTFLHIPPIQTYTALETKYPTTYHNVPFYATSDGDEGMSQEMAGGFTNPSLWHLMKDYGCTGIFMGHQHKIATSIVYDGIRLTYGLKTGTYDYHASEMLGATKISLLTEQQTFTVQYLYSDYAYNTNME